MNEATRNKYINYPAIQFWGEYLGSYQYYIDDEKLRAAHDKAPQNAIFKRRDGKPGWVTTDEIENPSASRAWQRWCEINHMKELTQCRNCGGDTYTYDAPRCPACKGTGKEK